MNDIFFFLFKECESFRAPDDSPFKNVNRKNKKETVESWHRKCGQEERGIVKYYSFRAARIVRRSGCRTSGLATPGAGSMPAAPFWPRAERINRRRAPGGGASGRRDRVFA